MSQNDSRRKGEALMRVAVSRVNVLEEMENMSAAMKRPSAWLPRIPGVSAEQSKMALGAVAAGGLWGWWRRRRRRKRERAAAASVHGGMFRSVLTEIVVGAVLPVVRDFLAKRLGFGK